MKVENTTFLGLTSLIFVIVILTRFLPFWLKRFFQRSVLLRNVGVLLPGVILLFVALHLFQPVDFDTYPYGLPEMVTVGLALGLFLWCRNLIWAFLPTSLLYLMWMNF